MTMTNCTISNNSVVRHFILLHDNYTLDFSLDERKAPFDSLVYLIFTTPYLLVFAILLTSFACVCCDCFSVPVHLVFGAHAVCKSRTMQCSVGA